MHSSSNLPVIKSSVTSSCKRHIIVIKYCRCNQVATFFNKHIVNFSFWKNITWFDSYFAEVSIELVCSLATGIKVGVVENGIVLEVLVVVDIVLLLVLITFSNLTFIADFLLASLSHRSISVLLFFYI